MVEAKGEVATNNFELLIYKYNYISKV